MAKRPETSENKGFSLVRNFTSDPILASIAIARASLEERALIREINDANHPDNYFSIMDKERPLSYEDARVVATVEAAAFLLEYKAITTVIPQFPPLYRFLRTCELAFGYKRGGKSILVGSGDTVPEVMAQYLEPPSEAMIAKVKTFDGKGLINSADSWFSLRAPEYRDGTATAVEPDERYFGKILELADKFQLTEHKIHHARAGIEEVLKNHVLPDQVDTIIWHRAEPTILNPNGKKIDRFTNTQQMRVRMEKRQEKLRELLEELSEHLKPGGQLLVTVGGGDDQGQLLDRGIFIRQVKDAVAQMDNYEEIGNFPLIFEDNSESIYFGGRTFGIVGCVVRKKTV